MLDLTNAKLIEKRPAHEIYEMKYKGRDCIVKLVTKKGLPRFKRERNIYVNHPHKHMPKLLDYGPTDINYKGGKYLIIEKVRTDWKNCPMLLQEVVNQLFDVVYHLSFYGRFWTSHYKHMGYSNGQLKIFDFNDDYPEDQGIKNLTFFDLLKEQPKSYSLVRAVKALIDGHGDKSEDITCESLMETALNQLIERRYPQLINVHEPIPFPEHEHVLRTETEKNDKKYGKRVPANRNCYDRFEMLTQKTGYDWKGKKVLDLGCNIGWFCFKLAEQGARTTGVEYARDMCAFSYLMAFVKKINTATFVNKPLALNSDLPPKNRYDVIMAFSMLHRLVNDEVHNFKYNKDYTHKMVKKLWDCTKEVLVIELPRHFIKKHFDNGIVEHMESIGAKVKVLGTTDNSRKMYWCEK